MKKINIISVFILIYLFLNTPVSSQVQYNWYKQERGRISKANAPIFSRNFQKTAASDPISQNIRLIAHLNDYPEWGYTDCWGYTSPEGNEYALLGVDHGVSIVDVSDTSNIVEAQFVPWVEAASLGWYDIKTYENYMYVSSEWSMDMLIVDLSALPQEVTIVGTFSGLSSEPHNIYIDTSAALLYAVEDVNWDPSVRIFSLEDPKEPVQLSTINTSINGADSHDLFAQDSVLYIAEGLDPSIGIYDVSDPSTPVLLTRLMIPAAGYVHQVWVSEDNHYMVTTEESYLKSVKIWDISDLGNIELISEYHGGNRLAHNAIIHEHNIFIAHYESGLKVLNFNDPSNIYESGFYDTYPDEGHNFNGAWGIYPMTQNELIYLSDIQSGLYILKFEQQEGPQLIARNADFQNVLLGSSDTLDIEIQNFGSEDLMVSTISEPEGPFVLFEVPELPFTVKPGQNIAFSVIFSPDKEQLFSENISIGSDDQDDPDYSILVKGKGYLINNAESGIYYAGSGGLMSGDILTIDEESGQATLLGNTGILIPGYNWTGEIVGLAVNSEGKIYCSAYSASELYSVDSKSGAVVLEMVTDIPGIVKLAFGPDDVLYATSANTIYSIDLENKKTNVIGNLGFFIDAFAFDPLSGDLWASTWPDNLFKVKLDSLSASSFGNAGLGEFLTALQFDNQGHLFGIKGFEGSNALVALSKKNGKGELIGKTGYSNIYSISTQLDTFWNIKTISADVDKHYIKSKEADSVNILADVLNASEHSLIVEALIKGKSIPEPSRVALYDDGKHNDGSPGDHLYGVTVPAPETRDFFDIDINAYPADLEYADNYLYDAGHFTNVGPVGFHDYHISSTDSIPNPGDSRMKFQIEIKNFSTMDSIFDVFVKLNSTDSCVSVSKSQINYGDLAANEIGSSDAIFVVSFGQNCQANRNVPFSLDVYSDNKMYWTDTFSVYLDSIATSISDKNNRVPITYQLEQNFPNPFNPVTTIRYQLPYAGKVELIIFNTLGEKVATLVSDERAAGYHSVKWNASGIPSGLYFYRIHVKNTTGKDFNQIRKLLLVK